jgi:hypothetical protein
MEIKKKIAQRNSLCAGPVSVSSYQPVSYKEMDDWLNSFSTQDWTALIGSYTAGGFKSVIEYMRNKYGNNLSFWKDKDLRHFWNSRNWTDFKSKHERLSV